MTTAVVHQIKHRYNGHIIFRLRDGDSDKDCVEAAGQIGIDLYRADLKNTDLRGADMRGPRAPGRHRAEGIAGRARRSRCGGRARADEPLNSGVML